MDYITKNIRNIALIGHAGEGKTTLAEAMLFNMNALDRQGRVEDGNTFSDFDPEEIARKTSISLSVGYGEYNGVKINVIDVPGFFDFEGEMIEALSVADGAVIVTGANGTVPVGAELCLDYCIKNSIPTMIFINGIDKENSDYVATVEAFRARYGKKIATMHAPIIREGKMQGYVSVISGKAYEFKKGGRFEVKVPPEMKDEIETLKAGLTEAAAETSEEYIEKFLDTGWLSNDEIITGLKQGLVMGDTIPVVGGSAAQNLGVINLLNEIVAIMPSPEEGRGALDNDLPVGEDETVVRVFKTIVDPFVGRLNVFKVIRGKIAPGMTLKNTTKGAEEKISALYFIKGKKQDNAQAIIAGDIGAVAKLTVTATGDTLTTSSDFAFPPLNLPAAVYSMAVYAAKKGDEDKVFSGLKKLKDEDISFEVKKNAETGEMLLSGLGDTQLAIICKKLKTKFGSEATLKEPRIAYRETVRKTAEAEGKHKKQSGGAGQFGDCWVRFEPGAEDGVYEFVDAVVGGAVPKQFIPAVDKGLREAVKEGVLAGYPMVNLKCTLFDGKYHPVDSKEIAFITAAKLAYQDGVAKASPCILEPIMKLEIVIPDSFLGDVMGDMNKRRGRILGTDQAGDKSIVTAEAPQSELTKYAIDLRSMTQGRGKFTTEFVRYEEVPPLAADKIIAEAKKLKAES